MFAKKKPLQIKKTTVTVTSSPKPTASTRPSSATRHRPSASRPAANPTALAASRNPRPRSHPLAERRTPAAATPPVSAAKRKRPASQAPDFGTEGESGEEDGGEAEVEREAEVKRRKQREVREVFKNRRVRSAAAFEEDGDLREMVHAAEIPGRDLGTKYEVYFHGLEEGGEVEVQYPSLGRERYQIVRAPHDNQGYDTIQDIAEVMHKTIEFYIPAAEQDRFTNSSSGFPQRLHRAVKKQSPTDLATVLQEWNATIAARCRDGSIPATIDAMVRPDPRLVEWIINQTHARTVSLNLRALHEYEAGTDNVYGELLPKFVSKICEDTLLGPDAVFVDLGSGVGNVVLQAALEAGCESWGCEMMAKYCDVADLQHREFVARCQLWGFGVGAIHLERGDFLANPRVHAALRRADVVLVNNQVFTPQTNDALTTLFLDLKDGCRVVSLKSFVPAGHRINVRNSQSPYSILGNIREKEYFSKSVSWTDQGGKYFISTKDQSFLTKYNANGP